MLAGYVLRHRLKAAERKIAKLEQTRKERI